MLGRTFLIPDGSGEPHLYVVIGERGAKILLVNFTEHRLKSDCSCTVSPGDHPFINKPSVVNYKDAVAREASTILGLEENKHISKHRDVSSTMLEKIREGARSTPFLKNRFLDYLD